MATRVLWQRGNNLRWWLSLEWEPRDCWLGVYWRRHQFEGTDVYLCLLPLVPVHLWVRWPA